MSAPNAVAQVDHDENFRREAREGFKDDIRQLATPDEKLGLLTSIQSFAFQIIRDATRPTSDKQESAQKGLDVLWYMFTETAKVLDKEDAIQDNLITMLLGTKQFDSFHKMLHPSEASVSTWESYGFADHLQEVWENGIVANKVLQQCNLATFSAKALALGICDDSLGKCALWYLREALENDDDAKTLALLPAAVIWIEHARHKLFTLSLTNKSYEGSPVLSATSPGQLAQTANVEQYRFSMDRWLLWRRRLQKLSHYVEPEVAGQAKKGFMSMIFCGRELGCDVPGEAKFSERLQKTMWEELVRSGKESVSGDEIDIKVDWVD